MPHITLVPASFQLPSTYYGCSFAVEIMMTIVCCLLLVLSIYFKCGDHKLILDQAKAGEKKAGENIICQVLEQTNYLSKLDESDSSSQSSEGNHKKKPTNYEDELRAQQLRIYERRLVYMCILTIPWVISVCLFTTAVLEVISLSALIGVFIGMNVFRMIPTWKITLLVYILGGIMGFRSVLGGCGKLYSWTPVV